MKKLVLQDIVDGYTVERVLKRKATNTMAEASILDLSDDEFDSQRSLVYTDTTGGTLRKIRSNIRSISL